MTGLLMNNRILAGGLLLATAAIVNAQTPAATGSSPGQGAAPATIEQTKGGDVLPLPTTQRAPAARPGAPPPPLNIKIQDTGVAMPKCAAESREGEACKK